ncbi:calmodulin-lysine N-methyltransferase [Culicoides brevitarsis]|uniref:calmodulin-lysine N-methyltransferase n=1 Tax=Culicoides brevitarsis TaxID=469753 RepID=UPI00307BAF13
MDFSSCSHHSVNDASHESNLKRITNARKRWRILARVLRRNSLESVNSSTSSIDVLSSSDTNPSGNSSPQTSLEDSVDESPLSVRTFDGFNLVQQSPLPYQTSVQLLGNADEDWFSYRMKIDDASFDINIHHINRLWTAQDLIGFNNTGNICVWPSEETLAIYVLEHLLEYKNSWVLELGGGMTSLAGLMIAKYGNPYLVHLTDGNALSVENVKRSLRLNDFGCFTKASVLKWEKNRQEAEREMYSVILCADCLFFDESREALVDTIEYYLAPTKDAKALVMAPKRGQTLELFIEQAKRRELNCKIVENYCDSIWRKHLDLKNGSHDYNEDIHYPLLIILDKNQKKIP